MDNNQDVAKTIPPLTEAQILHNEERTNKLDNERDLFRQTMMASHAEVMSGNHPSQQQAEVVEENNNTNTNQ